MIKFYRLFALCVIQTTLCLAVNAVPAYPWPVTVTQPDGTTVALQGHGDEWFNWTTTADGFTVVQDTAGYWCYAQEQDGRLTATPHVARDRRTEADLRWLATIGKNLLPKRLIDQGHQTRQAQSISRPHRLQGQGKFDYGTFRGLVILINYNDRQFIESDPHKLFDEKINQEHYTGYTDEITGEWVACTGSMHDYFRENTNAMFAPHFDVFGPVNIDYSETFVNQWKNATEIFTAAMAVLNDTVDFSQYDLDGDGVIDMVYFVVAGYASNWSGNPSSLLWPHASNMANSDGEHIYDGKRLGRYACSTELQGRVGSNEFDGIGTMCHEFSHVLGLPDLYDVDYALNGQSNHPGKWDLMAAGAHLNNGRTPAGYSVYERYAVGCLTPQVISGAGRWSLRSQQSGNEGLRLNTTVDNEFFLIENRQQEGWDEYLPGHGMLVWRVDSSDVDAWEHNLVNYTINHNHLELVRATNSRYDTTSDPFPGSQGVDSLVNNMSKPNLLTWAGNFSPYSIWNIVETDRLITFRTACDRAINMVEDFEQMAPTEGNFQSVNGRFTAWSAIDGKIAAVTDTLTGNGRRAIALRRGGTLSTGHIHGTLRKLSFQAFNPNSFGCTLRVSVSTDNGSSWQVLSTTNELSTIRLNGNQAIEISYAADNLAQPMLRFEVTSALGNNWIYLDDISIVAGTSALPADVNGDGRVDIADVNIVINVMLGKEENMLADVTCDGFIDIADVNAVINAMLGKW